MEPENRVLQQLSIVLICSGVVGLLLLWQWPSMISKLSQWHRSWGSSFISFTLPRTNRILLFILTFVAGPLLAGIQIGLRLGSLELLILSLLIALSPLGILSFPTGLTQYVQLAPTKVLYFYFLAWVFYLVIPILGILVKQRGLVIVLYLIFIIVLLLNSAGCVPVATEFLSGLN